MDRRATDMLATSEFSAAWHISTQRWRITVLSVLVGVLSAVSVLFVLRLGLVSPLLLAAMFVGALVIYQPRIGLYLTLALVVLFESGSEDQLMAPGRYFTFGLQSTVGISGLIISPLEMLLMACLMAWLAKGIMTRQLQFRGGRLGWPMLLFSIALVFGVVRGRLGGGDLYIAFWEVRALLYLVGFYVLAANVVRTPRLVSALTAICVLAAGLFAIEGAYRKLVLIDSGQIVGDLAYSHELAIFLGTMLLVVIAQQVVGAPVWQRVFGLLLTPITLFTLLASERRAAQIALIIAFAAFALVFLFSYRKAFFLIAVPAAIAMAVYLPLFWNSTGMIGQPARAIRSMYQPNERDASSNLYRDLEKINVRETIRANPLLGVGFGQPFYFIVPLPDLSFWPFWRFQPHHNILWVWLKIGAPGFIVFWVLMGSALHLAVQVARSGRDRAIKVFGFLALAALITTPVFCYVDLGLTMSRVTVFLGAVLGTLAVADDIQVSPSLNSGGVKS
jgi:hypothetical protein